jgi:acyl dehydratase
MTAVSRPRILTAAVGESFDGRSLEFTLPRILAFSAGVPGDQGWPLRNLHTDEEKAREAGLPAMIASGTQSEGLLIELMLDLFGEAWFGTGIVELKLPMSVFVGDTVTPRATVTEIDEVPEGRRYSLEVWCEKQTGDRVLTGTACGIPGG